MNKTSIKNYAIWARNELITRVSQKAFEYGVEKDNIIPADANIINGRLLSEDEKKKRQILVGEVKRKGYDQVIEEVAYTWFNRFIALRFMEVNNYLPNKVRLFTNEYNDFKPQIIDEALHIELLGLNKKKVIALKETNNNEELYKELLLATCNDMARYLPGMFKPISDFMTLLFPSNLLREESVLGRLISDIDEDSWADQVQIIGWLYQYYNTEPKEKVYARKSGTKIKKEEIPAVTQLFTPDWIVRYMTENSLGRLWLDGHPENDIKSNWKYYLDEADQEESVQIKLNNIKAEHAKLRPEDIKFLDPCMGSGHILVYAFDVFMQIYRSEGWTEREAVKSILQNNIYGLDIDERAYQLSYFALMMKARQYNRRILSEGIIPNVMAVEESNTFNKDLLRRFGDLKSLSERVVNIFIDAKEYGSILNVEFTKDELDSLEAKLNEINKMSTYGNLLDQIESDQLSSDFYPLLKQARIMSWKYECVVTNPPYMGSSGMNSKLSLYVSNNYPDAKTDLFSCFLVKGNCFTVKHGICALVTMQSWMFLSSMRRLREKLISSYSICNLLHLDNLVMHIAFGTAATTFRNVSIPSYIGTYTQIKLKDISQENGEHPKVFPMLSNRYSRVCSSNFFTIPGAPIAYWASENIINAFSSDKIGDHASVKSGMQTGNNDLFLKLWYEVCFEKIGFNLSNHNECNIKGYKWVPQTKGGTYRKWYGNYDYIVNFENDCYAISRYKGTVRLRDLNQYFKRGITWTHTTTGGFGARILPNGFTFNVESPTLFTVNKSLLFVLGSINSKVAQNCLWLLNSAFHYHAEDILNLPLRFQKEAQVEEIVNDNINVSKEEWDSFETSWDFKKHPLVIGLKTLKESYAAWDKECTDRFNQLKTNEEELNRIFIDIYGLQDELTPEVEDKEITVRKADLQREIKSLISYAVGCMFGRYSLDAEGIAYAGGEWDYSKYRSFIPDKDNIIPICDDEYFEDDIVGRFIEFVKAAYGNDTLEENLRFIADALGGKGTSREVIRSYFINDFYKDHCNTYQVTGSGKRPIYWQFDSGKKNGFKALIYIHRYTPDLIARMRTSYVHEQQSRYENQMSVIQNRIDSATSTSERVKAEKEMKKLKDQTEELRVYEEKIHHWADKMEPMDLDDGVKVNYSKFQELLTKIK